MNLKKLCHKIFYLWKNIYFIPRTLKESEEINKNVKYLNIVGLPRTGTSFLQQVLNSYKGIFVTYESIYYPVVSIKNLKTRHAFYYELIKQHVHMNKSLTGVKDSDEFDFREFSFEREYSYFGDKMIYDESFWFGRMFRNSIKKIDKVIFIVRDPRARYASYKKWIEKRNKKFSNTEMVLGKSLISENIKWNSFSKLVDEYCTKFDNCLFVRYEDLVQKPVEEVQKILRFLELNFSADKKSFLENIAFTGSVDKYYSELSVEEIEEINKGTISGRKAFCYED